LAILDYYLWPEPISVNSGKSFECISSTGFCFSVLG
jgi:hypothetical protein